MVYSKDFYIDRYQEYFKNDILPILKPVKNIQKKLIIKTIVMTLVFFISGIFIAALMLYILMINAMNSFIWAVLLTLMCICLFRSMVYFIQMMHEFDEIGINTVLKHLLVPFANFKQWPKNLNTENILDSQLFIDFFEQDDLESFFGFYNRTNIIISRTLITKPSRSAEIKNVFRGVLIQLELDKCLNNHVIIATKNEIKSNKLKKIYINNTYNQFLNIYTKTAEADIPILNDKIFKCLEDIAIAYDALSIKCSFKDNIVIIAVSSKKNPFRICNLFKPLNDFKSYKKFFNRFISVYSLVDEIKEIDM